MSILSNAISGLQASQIALRTTGHNISNANTEGYSRQKVDYGTRPEQSTGVGFLGSGVIVQSVERVVSQFLTTQLRADTSNYKELEKFDEQIGSIDKLLADSGTGLAAGLQSFFAALHTGADDPESTPARQLIISEAESLTSRFHVLYGRMDSLNNSILREASVVVSEINTLAKSIANLNGSIQQQLAVGQGDPPNDLLDKRDEQLRKLSELISIQVIEQEKGLINVTIGSGQPLVVGQAVSNVDINNSGEVSISNDISAIDITDTISGGQLGGLLGFRDRMLGPTLNELGRVAIAIAAEFNEIQHQGLDLDGDYGSQFFTDINNPITMYSRVTGAEDNVPPNDRDIYVEITDTSALTTDDYTLRLIQNTQNYVVTRNSDGAEVTQGILTGAFPTSIEFDGVVVHLAGGSIQGGDEYLIQPTRSGSIDMDVLIERPEDLAFALPIRTLTNEGNLGTGVISTGEILSILDQDGNLLPTFSNPQDLSPPLIIHFTSPTTFDVLDNSDPANPQHLVPPLRNQTFVPGIVNSLLPDDPGATLVTGSGSSMGLPPGSIATTQATGGAAATNGYPVEIFNFVTTDPITGGTTTQSMNASFNASASITAAMLSNMDGVTANAFTEAVVTDLNIANFSSPLQISLNGQPLIQYTLGVIDNSVPNPNLDEGAFNDYLAEQINNNPALAANGIYATSTSDPVTGNSELRLLSNTGADLDIRLEGVAGDNLSVNDGVNTNVRLTATGAGTEALVTVGGRIDLSLDDNVTLSTVPGNSQYFGDTSAVDFAQPSFLGYQIEIKGEPAADDRFTIEFNSDATIDNRNALRFVDMENRRVIEGDDLTISESYAHLVERVGTQSNLSKINTEASLALLRETETARDGVSGVNLDEEAANLIRFEQVYNANARVISVSRDLFDALLNAI